MSLPQAEGDVRPLIETHRRKEGTSVPPFHPRKRWGVEPDVKCARHLSI